MATSYSAVLLWGFIFLVGSLTFLIRLSFIGLFGYFDEIPSRIERALRFVPAAVLASLALPSFITLEPGAGGVAVDKLTAGLVAGGVAWRTQDVLATIAVGMATLWAVRFVLLPVL